MHRRAWKFLSRRRECTVHFMKIDRGCGWSGSYDTVGFSAVILHWRLLTSVPVPSSWQSCRFSSLVYSLMKSYHAVHAVLPGLFYWGHNLMLFDSVDGVGAHKNSWSASRSAVHISDRDITRRNSLFFLSAGFLLVRVLCEEPRPSILYHVSGALRPCTTVW
jgi:hypothetical protein